MIGLLNLPRGSTNYAIGASSYLIIPGVWTFKFFKIKNLKTNFKNKNEIKKRERIFVKVNTDTIPLD